MTFNRSLLFSIALVMLSVCAPAARLLAQTSATASISATIVTPTTVSKESDLEFEGVTFNTAQHLHTARWTRSASAGISEMALATKNVIKGSIVISGLPGYSYSITIPQSVTVAEGTQHLTIGTRASASSGNQVLSSQGDDMITIEGSIALADRNAIVSNVDDYQGGLPVIINNY